MPTATNEKDPRVDAHITGMVREVVEHDRAGGRRELR